MANNFTSIKERVLQIAKYHKVSYEVFCEQIGMTYGNFKGKAKNTPLNSDAVVTILSKFPDINAYWLLTGEGSMLRDSTAVSPQKSEAELKEDRLLALIESQQRTIENLSNK